MNNYRIKMLKKYMEENPGDPFNIYALALEYLGLDVKISKSYFDELLTDHPEYLPTYYHAANLYLEMGNVEEAKNMYEKGILLAEKQGDLNPLKELKNALNNLMIEDDE
jgi:tetratricopeptide (TPR) repeat protein